MTAPTRPVRSSPHPTMRNLVVAGVSSESLYRHQLRQTIDAYNPTQMLFGEALQNAVDAVVSAGGGTHRIDVELNFDARTVLVRDDGEGFPNDVDLLFLGGTRKALGNRKLFGLVGVGLKVVLFNSEWFQLRARNGEGAFRVVVENASRFDEATPPPIQAPQPFDRDPTPLPARGTEVTYRIPEQGRHDPFQGFVQELRERCFPREWHKGKTGLHKLFDSLPRGRGTVVPFARLLEVFVRRFTYAGDVLNRLNAKPELNDTTVRFSVTSRDPEATFGPEVGALFGGHTTVTADFRPTYLLVDDTVGWLPSGQKRPGILNLPLGPGGQSVSRMATGFNLLTYSAPDHYAQLLLNKTGRHEGSLTEYQRKLFPVLNGVFVTLGRIPQLEEFLPSGSRRVLSANGVVTSHEMEIVRGVNQQYVRCVDIVVDVDAELNYGKSQLKNTHLVRLIREFVNDAYKATLQYAAENWVGRLRAPTDEDDPDDERHYDAFLRRPDLGLDNFTFQKAPRYAEDVVALFFELAGRGMFPDVRCYGFSPTDQYMSRAQVRRRGEAVLPPPPLDDRQLAAVEFKARASDVVEDLERGTKVAQDLALVVAWEEGETTSQFFVFADAEYMRRYRTQGIPGAQRFISDTRTGAEVQVLLLKPLVEAYHRSGVGRAARVHGEPADDGWPPQ